MRALAYARATRPTFLEAITVDVDPDETEALRNEWARREIPVPLKVLSSPYREITRPIIDYVQLPAHRQPARRRHRLHPRVRRSAAGTSRSCTTRARCGSRPGCCSPRASWSPASRGSCARPRVRRTTTSTAPSSAPSAEARADACPRALVGTEAVVEVGPVAHGGHCVARLDGRVVFVRHALPGERVRVAHHRGRRRQPVPARRRGRGPRCLPGAGRAAVPVCRSGPVRRLRLPARRPGVPAAAQGRSGPRAVPAAGRARRRRRPSSRCRATTRGCAGARGSSSPSTPTGGRACAAPVPRHRARRRTASSPTSGSSTAASSTPSGPAAPASTRSPPTSRPTPSSSPLPGRTLAPPSSSASRPRRLVGGVPHRAPGGSGRSTPAPPPTFVAARPRDAPAAGGGAGPRPVCGCRPLRGGPRRRGRPGPVRCSPSRVTGPRWSTGRATPPTRPQVEWRHGRVDRVLPSAGPAADLTPTSSSSTRRGPAPAAT